MRFIVNPLTFVCIALFFMVRGGLSFCDGKKPLGALGLAIGVGFAFAAPFGILFGWFS